MAGKRPLFSLGSSFLKTHPVRPSVRGKSDKPYFNWAGPAGQLTPRDYICTSEQCTVPAKGCWPDSNVPVWKSLWHNELHALLLQYHWTIIERGNIGVSDCYIKIYGAMV